MIRLKRKFMHAAARFGCAGVLLCLNAINTAAAPAGPEQWPRWRGPADNGSTERGTYPARLDAQTLLWKTSLPGKGCSTPIVWNDRIYLTAPADDRDALLAFDLSGKLLWQTRFGRERPGKHRNGSGSNASPATDGQAVFVAYKSGTLAAAELDGRVRWQTNLVAAFGPENLYWDHGTSPVLTEKFVIMARMHHGDSWVAAFDKVTGALRWKVPRNYETPTEGDHGYGTPLVFAHRGRALLLVYGAEHLTLHDPADGRLLGSSNGFNPQRHTFWPTVASPMRVGEFVVVAAGRNDRNQPRLHGLKLGPPGGPAALRRLWVRQDIGTFVPTPAAYRGRVYLLRDRGEVECLDPATGKTVWHGAFPRHRSNYYASPLVAGGRLYAAREDGGVFVAAINDDRFALVSENDLGERVIASPVPVANRLLLRGEKHLFCFGRR